MHRKPSPTPEARQPLLIQAMEYAVLWTFAVLEAPSRLFTMAFFAMPDRVDDYLYNNN